VHDVAIVGAGIVGLATARELLLREPGLRLAVLEAEPVVGAHQTSHNSGVVHAGIYYAPGSLKARLCIDGAARLQAFCDEHGVALERCGKLVIARDAAELPRLEELERRGRANGVAGLRRLRGEEIAAVEPHAVGAAALHSPATGIVDFGAVARALAVEVRRLGGDVLLQTAVGALRRRGAQVQAGPVTARHAIACAGLQASRVATASGAPADPRIVPFRGHYLRVAPARRELVRGLIYPVPDPALPFLGVHLTRTVGGDVLLGPTAMLAGGLGWPGTWRVARRFWRTGAHELRLRASRRAFAAACARYVPALTAADVVEGPSGVRAQAVARDGTLLDDFAFSEAPGVLHVRNAPSPAATAALSIASHIADRYAATR